MEITMKEKDAISESLRAYVAKYPSQTKAAGSLKEGVFIMYFGG